MIEIKDGKGRHLIRQNRCSYLDENKSSCGCDKDLHVDITQPVVRFNQFNDSALDFSMWLYVKDYGAQFKTCLLYTSPSPRDLSTSRMPSSA